MKFLKGMKKEQKMLMGSLLAGFLAAALAFFLVNDVRKRVESSMDPVEVAAAAKYIPAFAELNSTNTKMMKIPRKLATDAHIMDLKKLKNKRTVVPFIENEAIMINKIAEKGGELNTVIPTGMRAVSIGINRENSVSYMIKPGDYVDVLLTYDVSRRNETISKTITVLQDVQVIAVGESIQITTKKQDAEYDTITLALTPEEAEIVTFSLEKGRINFSLRPVGDKKTLKVDPVTFDRIEKRSESEESRINAPVSVKGNNADDSGADSGSSGIKRRSIE